MKHTIQRALALLIALLLALPTFAAAEDIDTFASADYEPEVSEAEEFVFGDFDPEPSAQEETLLADEPEPVAETVEAEPDVIGTGDASDAEPAPERTAEDADDQPEAAEITEADAKDAPSEVDAPDEEDSGEDEWVPEQEEVEFEAEPEVESAQFEAMDAAIEAMNDTMPDASLTELEGAMQALGELTGTSIREDITARIFSRFCVGK